MLNKEHTISRELQHENLSSSEIAKRTAISQPTVSRILKDMPVIKLGRGRNTVFGLTTGSPPYILFESGISGVIRPLGKIYPQPQDRFVLQHTGAQYQSYEGLPFYLYDSLPGGFLGTIALKEIIRHDRSLTTRSQDWNDYQILHYLTNYGGDLPGNLIVGERMASLAGQLDYTQTSRSEYAHIVESINQFPENLGSSIAGEQPKFTVFDGSNHLIVKYSPKVTLNNKVASRHRDLMVCEHLALKSLREAGVAASETTLYIDDRFYLEVNRFDRIGKQGRKGIVSLKAIDAEYAGKNTNWIEIAQCLLDGKLISLEDFYAIEVAYAFGRYIANTDMHNGNFSFFMERLELKGTTPVYDMLPMAYMPSQGELRTPDATVPRFINISETSNQIAIGAAQVFWESVMGHPDISKDFKRIAEVFFSLVSAQKRALAYGI